MKNPANQSLDLVTLFAATSTWDGKSPYGLPHLPSESVFFEVHVDPLSPS